MSIHIRSYRQYAERNNRQQHEYHGRLSTALVSWKRKLAVHGFFLSLTAASSDMRANGHDLDQGGSNDFEGLIRIFPIGIWKCHKPASALIEDVESKPIRYVLNWTDRIRAWTRRASAIVAHDIFLNLTPDPSPFSSTKMTPVDLTYRVSRPDPSFSSRHREPQATLRGVRQASHARIPERRGLIPRSPRGQRRQFAL
jgi:hypothetical protein